MSGQAEPAAADEASPTLAPAGPLPAPAEPATTAPYVFDPAVQTTPETAPEPAPEPKKERKSRRALWGAKVKKEEAKPSMFPAPPPEAEVENGETP